MGVALFADQRSWFVRAERPDKRMAVSIEDIVRTEAKVDVKPGAVGVGVTEKELVCSLRRQRSGLADVSRGSIFTPCLLHSPEMEARKANGKSAAEPLDIESTLTRMCSYCTRRGHTVSRGRIPI
jgi:hypothetical protein